MPTDVIMPQIGESIFEGTITKWLKTIGDAVEKDEPLLEISTDKVDAELPSPAAGVLAEIRFPEGATVEVNTVVAVIGEAGATIPATAQQAKPAVPQAPPEARAAAQQPVQRSAPPQVAASPHTAAPTAGANVVPAPSAAAGRRVRSSPLARRIAKEHGIDLSRTAGTGAEGRITKEDVLRAVSLPPGVGQPAASKSAAPQVVPDLASLPADPVPLTRMRAIIAERMVESVRIAPHVHTVYKIDMTRIARLRDQHKDAFNQRHGVKLTYMPFIAAAAVAALRRFPIVNASLESAPQSDSAGLAIRYHQTIDLGIAVALDWGLIVPVIRRAHERTFASLARSIADLALRARAKKLSPDEVGNSTFTLTNAGAFGGEYGMPIINQPEAAILAVGGLRKEPAVLTDAEGNDSIAIRSMQYFCLGFDHRLIDGADAGKFMLEFKKQLESWTQEIV
ncbi:MAG: 2-oxoglutarate dehydrogenase, E2 component, dihydrolipoamide succinyltransferase [Terracidiphilus sp.]|jgi:2-oxoglutarate dehydrogenase E2 component (dihydrolipoamide succinyltransferase)